MTWKDRYLEWRALYEWACEHRLELERTGKMRAITLCLQAHWADMLKLRKGGLMKVVSQCRLWALRKSGGDIIFHVAETMLPTLFSKKKDADAFKKRAAAEDLNIEVVEVQIVLKEGA